jgi:hypothetical protein
VFAGGIQTETGHALVIHIAPSIGGIRAGVHEKHLINALGQVQRFEPKTLRGVSLSFPTTASMAVDAFIGDDKADPKEVLTDD